MLQTLFILLLMCSFAAFGVVDNSFLLEEGYQQPLGVYQFIQSFQSFEKGGGYSYNFAVEAPITDLIHQVSLVAARVRDDDQKHDSFSDMTVNYRYQLYNRDGVLVADRLGLVLPTGKVNEETGRGVYGVELMQAATIVFSPQWANHYNIGLNLYPQAKFADSKRRTTLTEIKAGTSWVYFFKDDVNFMLELFFQTKQSLEDDKQKTELAVTVSPGVRFGESYDWKEIEVVPGIGFPVQFAESSTDLGMLLYLSFEPKLH